VLIFLLIPFMDWTSVLGIDVAGRLAQGHVREISFAMATAFAVVVSDPVNVALRKVLHRWNFLLRTLVFVLLFTVGYPTLTFVAQRFSTYVLQDQKPLILLFLIAVAFFGFGFWADNQRR